MQVIRNEPYDMDQPYRYSELTPDGLDYNWEHVYEDFKEILCSQNLRFVEGYEHDVLKTDS